MIDNYDSFTYNLVQYLGELGAEVVVHRNDAIDLARIAPGGPRRSCSRPGPCTPNEAGISLEVIRELGGKLPMLGVCLGHQSIGQVFRRQGGSCPRGHARQDVADAPTTDGVFGGLANPFDRHPLPLAGRRTRDAAGITDRDDRRGPSSGRDEIMGSGTRNLAVEGVQFHPESILTQQGERLLENFPGAPVSSERAD